jgi:hypothetical protein
MDNELSAVEISVIVASISAFAAFLSALFSAINIFMTRSFFVKNKKQELTNELNKIIEISIEYPYVEDRDFAKNWSKYKNGELVEQKIEYLRYDMFCNRLYNHLHNVAEYYKYNKDKIENFVDIKSWVRIHKLNWQNPTDENENIDGYGQKFKDLINSYLPRS